MSKSILVLAGPSAVGKNTVAEVLLQSGEYSFVRSLTTRARRDSFTDEYIYVTREEFLSRVGAGEMLEYTEYAGNLYGTPKSEIRRALAQGKRALLILDIAGVKSLKASEYGEATFAVYLYAPLPVLERRLYDRELGTPSADGLVRFMKRKERNGQEYASMTQDTLASFDLAAENRDVAQCAAQVSERMKDAAADERSKDAFLSFLKER